MRRAARSTQVAVLIGLVGVLISGSVSWAVLASDRHNEHRLLEVQTRQAAAVISSTILAISDPLETALRVEEATGGDPQQFEKVMSADTGTGLTFASASLWESDGSSARVVATVGAPAALLASQPTAQAFIAKALHTATFVVTSVGTGSVQSVGYAIADPKNPKYAIYAERPIPANRQVAVESNSAFSELDYATYLGRTLDSSNVATTDVPMSKLPLSGDTVREVIPFGDTSITLVASARGQLSGGVGAALPWILLAGGIVVSIATAVAAEQLIRRRRTAELDAQKISALYEELDELYGQQRTIAQALQQALLPAYNPAVPVLEIASRYVAGAQGVDVGGDWYSLIALDSRHFAFAVGDVSGRGVSAAVIMARLRFTIRAYLMEGHPPDAVLAMCGRQLDVLEDGHFATVLVGIGDLQSREITVANAGHLNPLLVTGGTSEYVVTKVGLPLGIDRGTYESTTTTMPAESTLLVFTDGLVERREESIDVGLQRLAGAALTPASTLDDLLTTLVTELTHDAAEDDVALLAFRWRDPV